MSTRWYPLYQKGNPQLRVFLSNFFVKCVKPKFELPPNVVEFVVSIEMTKYDVKNYLEKIYKLPVVEVNTRIAMGQLRQSPGSTMIVKDDDEKHVYVTFPHGVKFEFPDLFMAKLEERDKENKKSVQKHCDQFIQWRNRNKHRHGVLSWFDA